MKYTLNSMFVFIITLLLIANCLLVSCERKLDITESIMNISLDSISSEIWFEDLMAVNTRNILGLHSKLCLVAPNEEYLTYFIDEKTGQELGYQGKVGNGPEDMQPWPIYVGKSTGNDTIFLYDFNARILKAYNVIETENGELKLKMSNSKKLKETLVGKYSSSYMALCKLQNGYFVGLNYLSTSNHFFTLLDEELNYVSEFGNQPLSGLPSKGKLKRFMSFDGSLYAYGNSIYYAAYKFSYMARYDIKDNGDVELVWTNIYGDIDYEIDNKNSILFKGETNLNGFSDIAIGEKMIFATYSGIPTGEMYKKRSVNAIGARTLVVFNHDGEVMGRFKLNSCSFSVGLSEDEEYLYIMNIDPEVQIERIRVEDIIKKIQKRKQIGQVN